MKTLADFLQWYNNLDVTPMVLDVCGISPDDVILYIYQMRYLH